MNSLIIGKYPAGPLLDIALSVTVPAKFAGVQLYKETAFDASLVNRCARPWATAIGPTGCNWSEIETSDGVFDWTVFDAGFTRAAAVPRLHFTLGRTPAWAGPAANQAPTVTQDYADMCTALATRARDDYATADQ